MKRPVKIAGLLGGPALCAAVYFLPIAGLAQEGRLCLGLTLMTMVWWSTQVTQSGFVSGIYLALLCLFKLADTATVFAGWATPTIWLVAGAYLLASGVKKSGLGERLSYLFILRFVKGWRSIIVSVFVLTLLLSLLIPSPWPRAFLILSVMSVVIRAAHIPQRGARIICFSIFAASVPLSLVFVTGDATLSPLVISYIGESVSFLRWTAVMGVPALVLSGLTLALVLVFYPPGGEITVDMAHIRAEQQKLGRLTAMEKRVIVWMAIAVTLWLTNGVTGMDVGWTTLLVAMLMSMPVIGEVLDAEDWREVPLNVMFFLTAAIAIGKVGTATGVTSWLAAWLLSGPMPHSPLLLALCVAGLCMAVHLLMGSAITALSVTIPMFTAMAAQLGFPPLAIAGLAHLAISGHYLLPFHHLNILVGYGDGSRYTQRDVVKMGLLLLPAIAVTVVFAVFWWRLVGVLPR